MAEEPDSSKSKIAEEKKSEPRKIPGNLPYMTNYGSIKKVLDKAITASKPDKLTQDYLANIFGLSGGSFRPVLPILRRVGLIGQDGTPTELYSKFRTESGRAEAVYGALRHGFAELFRRSEHIYAASDAKLTDAIVETTGLSKDDAVVKAIKGTFKIFSSYLPVGFSTASLSNTTKVQVDEVDEMGVAQPNPVSVAQERPGAAPLGLSYHINIVLPETRDAEVYNTIFKSLRDNLLR